MNNDYTKPRKINRKKIEADLFTGREKYIDNFLDTLNKNENPADSKSLTFFGMGGIGKSWLLKSFNRLINDQSKDYKDKYITVFYDFEKYTDLVTSLANIRMEIYKKDPEFSMPYFDLTLKKYVEISGVGINVDFVTPQGDRAHNIETFFDVLSFIPGLNTLNSYYKLAKTGGEAAHILYNKLNYRFGDEQSIREELETIFSRTEADDIKRMLVDYFIEDLWNSEREYSIIFFLDTFEKLTRERNSSNNEAKQAFLRFIKDNIPFTVWVLAGRDAVFNDPTKEFSVNDFSRDETEEYLYKSIGLEPTTEENLELINTVYKITTGTPAFLDVFSEYYRNNPLFDRKDFENTTKDELVERYIRYLDSHQQNAIEIMSAIAHWRDKDYKEVFNLVHNNSFSEYDRDYEYLINTNMIIKEGEDRRFLHETVRQLIYKYDGFTKSNKENTIGAIAKLYNLRAKEVQDEESVYYKERIIQFLEHRIINEEELSNENVELISKAISLIHEKTQASSIIHTNDFIEVIEQYFDKMPFNSSLGFELGSLLAHAGRYDESIEIEKRVYEEFIQTLNDSDFRLLDCMCTIGTNHLAMGNYEEAFDILWNIYPKYRNSLGEEHFKSLACLNSLNQCLYNLGRFEESLIYSRDGYLICKEIFGDNDDITLSLLQTYALNLDALGEYEAALDYAKYIYDKCRETLGEYHPNTLNILNSLSNIYWNLKEYKESLKCSEECYEKMNICRGNDHIYTLQSLQNLGVKNASLEQFDKALECFSLAYEKVMDLYGNNKHLIMNIANNIGIVHMNLGDFENAIPYLQQAYEMSEDLVGVGYSQKINSLANLAISYSKTNDYTHSYDSYCELYNMCKENLGEDHDVTIQNLSNMAIAGIVLNKGEESKELLKRVYEMLREKYGDDDSRTENALQNLNEIIHQINGN